jgi:hypothetical protein
MEGERETDVKDEELETYDVKHQNPKPIQIVTYLRNYEATDLWKKKRTLLVAAKRETSEIAQPEY